MGKGPTSLNGLIEEEKKKKKKKEKMAVYVPWLYNKNGKEKYNYGHSDYAGDVEWADIIEKYITGK